METAAATSAGSTTTTLNAEVLEGRNENVEWEVRELNFLGVVGCAFQLHCIGYYLDHRFLP